MIKMIDSVNSRAMAVARKEGMNLRILENIKKKKLIYKPAWQRQMKLRIRRPQKKTEKNTTVGLQKQKQVKKFGE